MSSAIANTTVVIHTAARKLLSDRWPLLFGLVVLYVPTLFDLATGLWITEGYAHSPMILGLSLWLLARRARSQLQSCSRARGHVVGWPLFIFGLLLYIVGRSQGILMCEIGSFVALLASLLSIIRGGSAIKALWFPFFLMLFMIPLPNSIVSALTLPMKLAVSSVTEYILFWFSYPIARSGVILQIGHYQLLVADACAGLQTLLTLEALGLFYLNVVRHTSAFRNIALACLIIPISFTANVIRVMALVLITYYFGDSAGQGFMHGFAGMLLFISALILIIGTDSFLQFIIKTKASKQSVSIRTVG
jgi:exosortase B